MKTKKYLSTILNLTIIIALLSAFTLTASASDGDICLSASIPTGKSAELVLQGTDTFADLKAEMEKAFEISFADDGFGVYCSDAKIYYDHKQPEDTQTLAELGFESGDKVYAEKTMWENTTETPIKLFGLTITGGTGCCEPYGDYTNVDYYWNYYYKQITIKTSTAIKISGVGEKNANILVSNGGKYTNLTVSDLSLTTGDGACIYLNPSSWLKLTFEGENTFISTGEDDNYGNEKSPAIDMNSSIANTYLILKGTGKLTATSYCEGMPGIGTDSEDTTMWGMDVYSGTVIANGGAGAPGIKTGALYMSGGNVTANGGEVSTEGIYVYGTGNGLYSNPLEIVGGVVNTSVIRPNQTDSNVGIVVINEGSDIDEIIDSNVYCNVNNDTTVTNGTKYYKINNSVDTEKASVDFFAGTTTLSSKQYAKAGDVVTLAVTPADGYEISDVKVNGDVIDEIDGDYEFTMPDEIAEITVTFAGDSTESYEWNIEYDAINHQAIVTAKDAGEYTVIFADYENGRLNDIDCIPVTLSLGENTVSQTDTSISLSKDDKVMIWNNMTEIVPVCTALTIK